MADQPVRVPFERLREFIRAAFDQAGLPGEDAAVIGERMAQADLQGSDGHGVIRVPQYLKRIKSGAVATHPRTRILEERTAMALLDGGNGMGHLVMKRAAAIAHLAARGAKRGAARRICPRRHSPAGRACEDARRARAGIRRRQTSVSTSIKAR